MCDSEVQKFYKDTNVFITGGTGFLGKILIEKLLRTTDVSTVYLLIREKKGKNMHTRVEEILEDKIFCRLKHERPKFKHQVVGIAGDCSVAGLGLTLSDKEKILANTNIVFHVAATVRFDENLKLAYSINVKSAGDVLELARQMKQLKALMHTSTAFSHCHREVIDEEFYDSPDFECVASALEKLTEVEAAEITPSLLGKWPNTYTFTKALAESLIRNRGRGLPVGIYRPGIVISTCKEPIGGWIDNLYGPTGVCAGAASGVLRTLMCDKRRTADIVPVDTCVAGLIVAAMDVHRKHKDQNSPNDDIPIYNYVSSPENPITWDEFNTLNIIHGSNYPLANSLWTVNFRTTKSEYLYHIQKLFYHLIPALLVDTFFACSGQSPKLMTMYSKIHKFSDVLSYFCCREWQFSNHNVQKLWLSLNEKDKELFPLSITTVHWLTYFRHYIKGIRQYLLDDPEYTLEQARKRMWRFEILQDFLRIVFYFAVIPLMWVFIGRIMSIF